MDLSIDIQLPVYFLFFSIVLFYCSAVGLQCCYQFLVHSILSAICLHTIYLCIYIDLHLSLRRHRDRCVSVPVYPASQPSGQEQCLNHLASN